MLGAGHLLAEHDAASGVSLREYVWLGDTVLAMVTGTSTPAYSFVTTGNLNEPLLVTNASGAVVSNTTRDPWGNVIVVAGGVAIELGYPGQWADSAVGSGLFQNWMRDYDPALGRYAQADPIGLDGGSNLYAYVGGDPVNWVDPTGEYGVVGGLVGGVSDLAFQMLIEGKSLKCVSWTQVGMMTALGAVTGGGASAIRLGRAWKIADRSMEARNAVRRFRRFYDTPATHDVHHWLFRSSSRVPNWLKNHPLNFNPLLRRAHRLVHSKNASGFEKWWYGHPDWAKVAQTVVPLGGVADRLDNGCGCQ